MSLRKATLTLIGCVLLISALAGKAPDPGKGDKCRILVFGTGADTASY